MIALFPCKANPPHMGHITTLLRLKDDYDKIIVDVLDVDLMISFEEIVVILKRVLDCFPNKFEYSKHTVDYEVCTIGPDFKDMPKFDVILTGNKQVYDNMKKNGFAVRYVERTPMYRGAMIREAYMREKSGFGITTKVIWNDIPFEFYTSTYSERMRAEGCYRKEPKTNIWIDSFEAGDVFYDIGANVGVYSLYAAKKQGCEVYAFEPAFHNFATLNKNIILNLLTDKIRSFCISLHDKIHVDNLFMKSLESGDAMSEFATGKGCSKYIQGCVAFSIDELVKYLPFPSHIKIDVDGNENLVLKGMATTIKNPKLKSILVEIRRDKEGTYNIEEDIYNMFDQSGFKLIDTEFIAVEDNLEAYNHIFKRGC